MSPILEITTFQYFPHPSGTASLPLLPMLGFAVCTTIALMLLGDSVPQLRFRLYRRRAAVGTVVGLLFALAAALCATSTVGTALRQHRANDANWAASMNSAAQTLHIDAPNPDDQGKFTATKDGRPVAYDCSIKQVSGQPDRAFITCGSTSALEPQ